MAEAGMGEALGFLAGLDNGQDQRYEQLARDLVNHLFVLIRSAGMHDLANEAMERPFVQLAESVNIFIDGDGHASRPLPDDAGNPPSPPC